MVLSINIYNIFLDGLGPSKLHRNGFKKPGNSLLPGFFLFCY